ncbi:uncharacterized protein LOC143432222 [Xylocopa sonorina]|uniref:uncharacterized protein LOC143423847 n=1 Tax=Xylocopa sonorina TaxID=1818115 RepID=UPI00403B2E4B
MFRKSKGKSATKICEHPQQRCATPANLYVSPSLICKFQKFVEKKQKSHPSKSSLSIPATNGQSPSTKNKVPKNTRLISELPQDTAVHFGNFYGIQETVNKAQAGRVRSSLESTAPFRKLTPRFEFTRQMVQKLERTVGTENYARQVSDLLEEIVEPAHFKLHSLPTKNSIPDGRHNPTGFPLWYKEPYKMPLISSEVYKLLQEKFDGSERRAKDIFDEMPSEKNSLKEWSEDKEMSPRNVEPGNLLTKPTLSLKQKTNKPVIRNWWYNRKGGFVFEKIDFEFSPGTGALDHVSL